MTPAANRSRRRSGSPAATNPSRSASIRVGSVGSATGNSGRPVARRRRPNQQPIGPPSAPNRSSRGRRVQPVRWTRGVIDPSGTVVIAMPLPRPDRLLPAGRLGHHPAPRAPHDVGRLHPDRRHSARPGAVAWCRVRQRARSAGTQVALGAQPMPAVPAVPGPQLRLPQPGLLRDHLRAAGVVLARADRGDHCVTSRRIPEATRSSNSSWQRAHNSEPLRRCRSIPTMCPCRL